MNPVSNSVSIPLFTLISANNILSQGLEQFFSAKGLRVERIDPSVSKSPLTSSPQYALICDFSPGIKLDFSLYSWVDVLTAKGTKVVYVKAVDKNIRTKTIIEANFQFSAPKRVPKVLILGDVLQLTNTNEPNYNLLLFEANIGEQIARILFSRHQSEDWICIDFPYPLPTHSPILSNSFLAKISHNTTPVVSEVKSNPIPKVGPIPLTTIKGDKPITIGKTVKKNVQKNGVTSHHRLAVLGLGIFLMSAIYSWPYLSYWVVSLTFNVHRMYSADSDVSDSLEKLEQSFSLANTWLNQRGGAPRLTQIAGEILAIRFAADSTNYFSTSLSHRAALFVNQLVGKSDGSTRDTLLSINGDFDRLYRLLTYSYERSPNSTILSAIKKIVVAKKLLTTIPQIVSPDKQTKIAIIIQNSDELRPTGGFLTGVGMLTLDQGKLINYDWKNIYDLDSQLKGTIIPPAIISQYLDQSSWYLRDANWDPDFVVAADNIAWFLEKETGVRPDVVISINQSVLEKLLDRYKSSLGDEIAYSLDQVVYQNGGEADALLVKSADSLTRYLVSGVQGEEAVAFLQILAEAVAYKDLMLSVTNSQGIQSIVYSDMSGAILPPACQDCIGDLFHLNEANVGVNRVNQDIDRLYQVAVELAAQKVDVIHQISLSNNSLEEKWPGGDYKSYIRALIPLEAQALSVSVDSQNVPIVDVPQSQRPYRTIGLPLEVKIGEKKNIVFRYSLARNEAVNKYVLKLVKQSGTSANPVSLNVTSDTTFSVFGHPQNDPHHYQALIPFQNDLLYSVELTP